MRARMAQGCRAQYAKGHQVIRSSEFWGGLFWLALGGFVTWAGRDLGLGKLNEPGAGFALFWIGLLLMGFAASIMLVSFANPGPALSDLWRDTRWAKVLVVIGLLIAFGFLFERLGFIVCATLMLLILMLVIDPVRPVLAIPIALTMPFGIWWVVTRWLKIQMPTGILSGILG